MGLTLDLQWKMKTLLVMAALWLAACGQSQQSNPASSSTGNGNQSPATKTNTNSQSSAALTPPVGEARQNLIDAYKKLKAAYPYRLTETSSGTANNQAAMPETVRVVEFAAADRVHAKKGSLDGQQTKIWRRTGFRVQPLGCQRHARAWTLNFPESASWCAAHIETITIGDKDYWNYGQVHQP